CAVVSYPAEQTCQRQNRRGSGGDQRVRFGHELTNGCDGHDRPIFSLAYTLRYMVRCAVVAPVKRRPRGSLTRQQVVEAALRLADSQGTDTLSMSTLARALECGVMTLYGYIANRDDLLDAIALHGLTDLRLPRPLPSDAAGILLAWGRARWPLPWIAVLFVSVAL